MKVAIAPDFRDLFRPLTPEELEQAKANNLADPEHARIPPIAVWEGIVIDGHHTMKIRENLRIDGKPVKVRYCKMDFPDRQSALAYAIRAQLGRRNLDASQIAMALAKLPKSSHGGDRKSDQSANLPIDRKTLAADHGIGAKTLQHADKVNEHGASSVKAAVTAGEVSVSDAATIADLPKGEQTEALKAVRSGAAKTLNSAAYSQRDEPEVAASVLLAKNTDKIKPTREQLEKLAAMPEKQQNAIMRAVDEGKTLAAAIKESGILRDAKGKVIPTSLQPAWNKAIKFDAWSRQLSTIAREIKAFCEDDKRMGAYLDVLTLNRDIRNCKHALKFAKPYVVCPTCKGDGCNDCRDTGWMPQTSLTRNAPSEEDGE